jgi:hypothetical protein
VIMSRCPAGRILALGLLSFILAAPSALSGDRDFQAIVSRLSVQYQKKPMRFMGLLTFIANRFTPSGVSHLKLAVFEDLNPSRHPADADIDAFVQSVVAGAGFQPFVRVRSNRDGEQTLIYARETGKKLEMLIVSLERDEAVVLKMRLSPEAMDQWLDEPVRKGRDSSHGSGRKSAE